MALVHSRIQHNEPGKMLLPVRNLHLALLPHSVKCRPFLSLHRLQAHSKTRHSEQPQQRPRSHQDNKQQSRLSDLRLLFKHLVKQVVVPYQQQHLVMCHHLLSKHPVKQVVVLCLSQHPVMCHHLLFRPLARQVVVLYQLRHRHRYRRHWQNREKVSKHRLLLPAADQLLLVQRSPLRRR